MGVSIFTIIKIARMNIVHFPYFSSARELLLAHCSVLLLTEHAQMETLAGFPLEHLLCTQTSNLYQFKHNTTVFS